MTAEVHPDAGAAAASTASAASAAGTEASDPERPNVSGDLPAVLGAAPMFRRAVAGYDRFEVDTYVRWAEDELATAAREHDRLEARHLRIRAQLEEARELLTHSPGGGELLRLSRRTGALLAAAADEAASIRAEGEAERSAATAEAGRIVARARRAAADTEAEAERLLVRATSQAEEATAAAARLVAEADDIRRAACAQAEARLAEVRVVEQRADEEAARIRRLALADAVAARLQARHDVVAMMGTGREERRRADEQAAATRERLDREAASRRAALLAEVQILEDRRSALRAEVDLLARSVAGPTPGRWQLRLRRLLERPGRRSAFHRSH